MKKTSAKKENRLSVLRSAFLLALCAIFVMALNLATTFALEYPGLPDEEQSPASAGAAVSDPDFNTINDPLNGEFELFTVDDLLTSRTKPQNGGTTSQVNNYIMLTENESISSASKRTVNSPPCYLDNNQPDSDHNLRQPVVTRIGRFFDLSYDVYITLGPTDQATGSDCTAPTGEQNMTLTIRNVTNNDTTRSDFSMSAVQTAMAMNDFNQDGFEDLFIMSDAEVMVATADDVANRGDGMRFGAPTALPSDDYASMYDPATGDLNADGFQDVAWIGNDFTVHFATVCPGAVDGTICAGKEELEILLDPLQSQSVPINLTPSWANNGCIQNVHALAAGNFTVDEADGLLVFDCWADSSANKTIVGSAWYQFDNNWNMIDGAPIDTVEIDGNDLPYNTFAQAAKLDWFGNFDQVVFAIGSEIICAFPKVRNVEDVGVIIISGNTMTVTVTEGKNSSCSHNALNFWPWVNGLAVGRFTSVASNETSETGFNQQIATLLNDGSLRIYEVSPPLSFQPTLVSESTSLVDLNIYLKDTPSIGGPPDPDNLNWLSSGDLQGRSARLGPPSIVRVSSHSQPSVILGAPPMHVDYILPDSATGNAWEVVNFTAGPNTYNSNYTMSQTTSNQSADTSRTSYTYATTKEGQLSVGLKIPYLADIEGSIKKATEEVNENISENYAFTENEFKYDASTTTGFGDQIWYDVSSFNVYFYPVLGITVCPADNPNCSPGEKQPLYVTFSGPVSSGTGPGPGHTTEWYQPVHEPGNIFSYPWNLTQLRLQHSAGIDLLTGPKFFFTDDSDQVQRLQWSSGSGGEQTAGTTNTHSYETAYSLSAGKQFGNFLKVNVSGSLNYNDSTAIGTLNKSTSAVGASQGIAIAKPGTFRDIGLYRYRVEPYIFGRTPPPGTVDSVTLPQDIQTIGPLQAAFAANPLDPNAGSWWGSDVSPYQQYIDVALNHPMRWSLSTPTGTYDELNCLPTGGFRNDCMVFNDPNPSNLWNSQFYWMRGLFVTVGGVNGPQRTQATAEEQVTLRARVYNYSFKDMSAGSIIKVQFYRQQINGTTPSGDSVLIAEEATGPLPGFNSPNSPNLPNWTTVSTTFDTTGLDNTYHIFWVLVWVEDSSGNMIAELPGHGLDARPESLNAIGEVPLEEVTFNGEQKSFSNNVGYLHSKFYIAPAGLQASPPASPVLIITDAQAVPANVLPGERVIVSAEIQSLEAPADAVHLHFYSNAQAWHAYQADPTLHEPEAFDLEELPFIEEGKTDRSEVPYTAEGCGKQTLLVVAHVGAAEEAATAEVTLDKGPCISYSPVLPVSSSN